MPGEPLVNLLYLQRRAQAEASAQSSDTELLLRFTVDREQAAFEVLLLRHGPLVWDLCRHILRDTHNAEDAFQATFLVLARKAGVIRKRESVGSWLYGVALR